MGEGDHQVPANQRNPPFLELFDYQTSVVDKDLFKLALSSVRPANSFDNLAVATLFIILHNSRDCPAEPSVISRNFRGNFSNGERREKFKVFELSLSQHRLFPG